MTRRVAATVAVVSVGTALIPLPAAAHGLSGRLDSPLPLIVYLVGAAVVVGLSFLIVVGTGSKWRETPSGPATSVPRVLALGLRAVGLVGWLWIMAQLVFGGSSAAEISTLFTWVYGWVGIAIVSALIGPVWVWIDPFSTLHDIGAWVWRRTGITGWSPAPYPERLAHWPAVIAFALFIWLELAYRGGSMGAVVLLYTVVTLAGMAQYGREAWRTQGELFTVWFGLLGRLAPFALAAPPWSRRVRRQHFPDGLVSARWDTSSVVVAALGAAAIIYDGLSQTQPFFALFAIPDLGTSTVLLAGFLLAVSGVVLAVARSAGLPALGAGLIPIGAGYLIAHYLTFLLGDGQRIIIAVSDPFQLGWDLFGTAFYEPSTSWLSPALVWLVMIVAVIGGHICGAWAGHYAALREARGRRDVRRAQVPLAIVMVGLTTMTLWSLGQNIVRPGVETPASAAASMVGR